MKREFPVPDPELVGSELYLTPYIGQTQNSINNIKAEIKPHPLYWSALVLYSINAKLKSNLTPQYWSATEFITNIKHDHFFAQRVEMWRLVGKWQWSTPASSRTWTRWNLLKIQTYVLRRMSKATLASLRWMQQTMATCSSGSSQRRRARKLPLWWSGFRVALVALPCSAPSSSMDLLSPP